MAPPPSSTVVGSTFYLHPLKNSWPPSRPFFYIPTSLSLMTCAFIFIYIYQLSKFAGKDHAFLHNLMKLPGASYAATRVSDEEFLLNSSSSSSSSRHAEFSNERVLVENSGNETVSAAAATSCLLNHADNYTAEISQRADLLNDVNVEGININNSNDVFHNLDLFLEDYKEMNKTFKIYIYPHQEDDLFANILLPEKFKAGGNYASESCFKKSLFSSHFLVENPLEADLFYLPFSIATMRNDPRVGVGGIPDFIRDYIYNISHNYPFWNKTNGADHFYVSCHSISRSAMEKAEEAKFNAIQLVCSASYFISSYIAHKDASIPQIWPRKGKPINRDPSKREKLAFYAGAMNSRERKSLVQVWGNDSDLSVHQNRLKTPYSEALIGSKYCIHAKGYEVNTARIGDAIFHGCVPVILADYYDLPFGDILNWKKFSVVVSATDVPLLKEILQDVIEYDDYLKLHENVLKVQKHFQWHEIPVDFDAFYMAMYELWIRRSHMRIA